MHGQETHHRGSLNRRAVTMPPSSSSTAPPLSTLPRLSLSPFLLSTTATASLSTRALDARRTRRCASHHMIFQPAPKYLLVPDRCRVSLARCVVSFSSFLAHVCVASSSLLRSLVRVPRRRVTLCPATPSTQTSSPHLLHSQIHASDVSTSPVFLPPPPVTLDLDSTHPHPAALCHRPITPVVRALRPYSFCEFSYCPYITSDATAAPSWPLPTSRATFGQSMPPISLPSTRRRRQDHLPRRPHRSRLLRLTPPTRELVSGQYITLTLALSTTMPSPLLSPCLTSDGIHRVLPRRRAECRAQGCQPLLERRPCKTLSITYSDIPTHLFYRRYSSIHNPYAELAALALPI